MCPHSDRAANQDMSFATFVMTNIIPQAPNVNRKAWEQLESYCRDLVTQEHDRLYITSGPAGQGGRGSRGLKQTIGGGRVVVPAECWEIIVVIPESGGSDDLSKLNSNTRVITVEMPNDQDAVGEEWAGFRTSASQVEKETGLHFFDRVKPEIAASLREKVDHESIPCCPRRASLHGKPELSGEKHADLIEAGSSAAPASIGRYLLRAGSLQDGFSFTARPPHPSRQWRFIS